MRGLKSQLPACPMPVPPRSRAPPICPCQVITGERPLRGHLRLPRVPEECSQAACNLMMACLSLDPATRPTAGQLLQHLGRLRRSSSAVADADTGAACDHAAAMAGMHRVASVAT